MGQAALPCPLTCTRKCSHARRAQIARPRSSILLRSTDERKDRALYPPCNPIHTHSHTFTHSGAVGLWWLEASYLLDFKHADSERFDLAFRDAAAVTTSLAVVGFQAPEKWTRSLSKHTAFLPLSDRVNIFFNASTPTNPQNPQ